MSLHIWLACVHLIHFLPNCTCTKIRAGSVFMISRMKKERKKKKMFKKRVLSYKRTDNMKAQIVIWLYDLISLHKPLGYYLFIYQQILMSSRHISPNIPGLQSPSVVIWDANTENEHLTPCQTAKIITPSTSAIASGYVTCCDCFSSCRCQWVS